MSATSAPLPLEGTHEVSGPELAAATFNSAAQAARPDAESEPAGAQQQPIATVLVGAAASQEAAVQATRAPLAQDSVNSLEGAASTTSTAPLAAASSAPATTPVTDAAEPSSSQAAAAETASSSPEIMPAEPSSPSAAEAPSTSVKRIGRVRRKLPRWARYAITAAKVVLAIEAAHLTHKTVGAVARRTRRWFSGAATEDETEELHTWSSAGMHSNPGEQTQMEEGEYALLNLFDFLAGNPDAVRRLAKLRDAKRGPDAIRTALRCMDSEVIQEGLGISDEEEIKEIKAMASQVLQGVKVGAREARSEEPNGADAQPAAQFEPTAAASQQDTK